MVNGLRVLLGGLMVAALLLLGGCSDFDEMRSQSMLNQAEVLLNDGAESDAEVLLRAVVEQYPRTKAADGAARHLLQIQKRRDFIERQEFAKVLDSYRQVFNGYRSVYAAYPQSMAEFDQSGYFFDSSYLQEITPADFQVYLWLTGDSRGFKAWCVRADKERSYFVDGSSPRLIKQARDLAQAELQEKFEVVDQKGSLYLVRPRS